MGMPWRDWYGFCGRLQGKEYLTLEDSAKGSHKTGKLADAQTVPVL